MIEQENQARRAFAAGYEPFAWDHTLSEVPDATILPQTIHGLTTEFPPSIEGKPCIVYDGGVYDGAGRIVVHAVHVSGAHRNVPGPWIAPEPETVRIVRGTWLYGGLLRGHVGHFFTESLGRCWGAATGDFAGTVFIGFNGRPHGMPAHPLPLVEKRAAQTMARPFIPETLGLLGVPAPYLVVGRPVRVETLIVPSQMLGNVRLPGLIAGHPVMRDRVRAAVDRVCGGETDGNRKIYISRSRLGTKNSSFLMEDVLEDGLRSEGYEILYPESLTVEEQWRAYRQASKIILSIGSAAHVLSFALNGRQEVALLVKSRFSVDKHEKQLMGFGARSLVRIQISDGVFWPKDFAWAVSRRYGEQAAIHTIDFDVLWSALAASGFVDRPFDCPDIDSKRREAILVAKHQLGAVYEGKEFELMDACPDYYSENLEKALERQMELRDRLLKKPPPAGSGMDAFPITSADVSNA